MLTASKKFLYGICYLFRNILDPFFMFEEVAILAYHSISTAEIDTAIAPEAFEKQLCYLRDKGFSFVTLQKVIEYSSCAPEKKDKQSLRKAVAITFDDGYVDFETAALPILEKYAAPVTLFVIGADTSNTEVEKNLLNTIPRLSPEALKKVSEHDLVEIGYHSMTHANLARISGAELEKEIVPITMSTGQSSTTYFAYPGGNFSEEAVRAVEKAGYEAAFSIKRHLVKRGDNRYVFPRTVVTRDMQPWMVGAHVTKAIEWYRAITNVAKI